MAMNSERIVVHIDADLEDLIPGYLENRQKDIKNMKNALVKGDYDTVRILGHSMKGSGGGYGFDEISEIGKLIEESAKQKDDEAIRKLIERLSNYLERINIIYG